MALALYNSLTRHKDVFVPADPARVTMYACGPTVYNPPHIGNARAAVVYDVLYRVLRRHFPNVVYARNITDVDDKINLAAQKEGVPIAVISARYTEIYHRDVAALGVLPPVIEPRATEHIPQMISMITTLLEGGHAYEAEGHVLFHVPSFETYGRLSGRSRDEMIAGARVEVAPFKRDPADFVLWKPSPAGIPGWDSPWGHGRPGWHLECSAMSEAHLGTTIDIHGGGNDLKFPHHENEIAQSTCAHGGRIFARYWVHNGFVEIEHEKMSKSLGNVLLVQNLLQRFPGEALRLALIKGRYREPISWSDDLVNQAKAQLDRLYGALQRMTSFEPATHMLPAAFTAAMDDDLNTPQAIAHMMALAGEANSSEDPGVLARVKGELLACGHELGLLQADPEAWFRTAQPQQVDVARVEALIAQRAEARAARDWATADKVRAELTAMGIAILDGAAGTQWRVEGAGTHE
jgi:cysteinyl-tRNA synthetase